MGSGHACYRQVRRHGATIGEGDEDHFKSILSMLSPCRHNDVENIAGTGPPVPSGAAANGFRYVAFKEISRFKALSESKKSISILWPVNSTYIALGNRHNIIGTRFPMTDAACENKNK